MNSYELTLVLPGGATAAKKKSVAEKIEKLVKAGDGKIKSTDEWGKIDLAYTIKKETQGEFIHLILELDGAGAKNLKDKLRLESGIIRYLLVRNE